MHKIKSSGAICVIEKDLKRRQVKIPTDHRVYINPVFSRSFKDDVSVCLGGAEVWYALQLLALVT